MRIDSAGNVGIGTSSPATYGKLAIAGTLATVADNNGYALYAGRYNSGFDFATLNTSADTTGWDFQVNGTGRMRITSAGLVGIGTSNPTSSLVVAGEASGTPTVEGVHLGKQGGYAAIELVGTSGTGSLIDFTQSGTDLKGRIYYDNTDNYMGLWTNATQRMRINSGGLITTNIEGSGTLYAAYSARAWVNFNGTTAANVTGTYSQTGTTVTVTITGHGYLTGQPAFLDFTSGTAVDGVYSVTVTGDNTFTVTQASRTTSGNVTSRRNTIRGSGNVSSVTDNAVGTYTVNFTTAMPDANYAVAGSVITDARIFNTAALSSSNVTVYNIGAGSSVEDNGTVSVVIFR